ncbi:putative reverse transcriptase domain-containing protein [Tanacetum coccineum]
MELENHVPVYILEPKHPEDLVPAEDEAPLEAYITEVPVAPTPPLPPPSSLPSLIRPPRTRAAMARMRAAAPSTYHLLLPSGTLPLLPIPLPAPSTSRRANIPEADMPLRNRLLLTAPIPRIMATINQGMSVEEIEQIVAQRVDNAIEAITIYESINQTKQLNNKKEYLGSLPLCNKCKFHHNGPSTILCGNWKKEYAGNLPLYNKCKFHHIGLCAARCDNCKWRGHQARDYRISGPKAKPRPSMAKLKAEVTCYECGELGHYKRDCPIVKLQNRVDKYWKGNAHGYSSATTSNINI